MKNKLQPNPSYGSPEFHEFWKEKLFEKLTRDLSDIKTYSRELKSVSDVKFSEEDIKTMFALKNKQLIDIKNNNYNYDIVK